MWSIVYFWLSRQNSSLVSVVKLVWEMWAMANPKYVDVVRKGKQSIDEWRESKKRTPTSEIMVQKLDLSGADLREANLAGTVLNDSDLSHAELCSTRIFFASLSGINFQNTDVEGAKVESPDWLGDLCKLNPPVEYFDFDYWSIAERIDKHGQLRFVIVGPAKTIA